MSRILLMAMLLVGLVPTTLAAEMSFDEIMLSFGSNPEAVEESATTGRIETLNFTDRTGTIGGHRYHFGPSTLSTPLRVKLLGRDFGSLQLLDVGMDVRVYYFSSPSEHRIATEIVQIEESKQH